MKLLAITLISAVFSVSAALAAVPSSTKDEGLKLGVDPNANLIIARHGGDDAPGDDHGGHKGHKGHGGNDDGPGHT